ncbi:MAG: SDR family NAD(P)-dependent oxidoreductase [Bryobacterales bacterium]
MAAVGRLGKSRLQLRDKTVLITGASAGIGRACALAFAAEGARLILTGRSREQLDETARLAAPAECFVFPADLCDAEAIAGLSAEVRTRFQRLDVVVNNAGVGLYIPSYQSRPDAVRHLFELNVFAPVELNRLLLPLLGEGAWIVNVSSIVGKVPLPWMPLYAASKCALSAYSDALRMELDGSGVRVLAVHPGAVSTGFGTNALDGELPANVGGRQRWTITPEQCAAAILAGMRKGKRTIVTPRIGWALVIAARLFPGLLYKRLAGVNPYGRYRRPS